MSCAIAVCRSMAAGGVGGQKNGRNLGKIGVRIPRRESNYPLKAAEILTFGQSTLDPYFAMASDSAALISSGLASAMDCVTLNATCCST